MNPSKQMIKIPIVHGKTNLVSRRYISQVYFSIKCPFSTPSHFLDVGCERHVHLFSITLTCPREIVFERMDDITT